MNAPESFFARHDVLGICPNAFANFVAKSIEVRTNGDFVDLINHWLQPIFPHGMMIAGVGHVQSNGIVVQRAIGINYPEDYVAKLQSCSMPAGPILTKWIETQEPQLFEVERPPRLVPRRWLNAARQAGIQNVAAHGTRDAMGSGASYFTFSRIPGPLGQHQRRVLATVVPHLYGALLRVMAPRENNSVENYHRVQHRLTPRELQILDWIGQGKRDAFIAKTMNRSIFTINNHVKNILEKLGAENRRRNTGLSALLRSPFCLDF